MSHGALPQWLKMLCLDEELNYPKLADFQYCTNRVTYNDTATNFFIEARRRWRYRF
jgi:hypothetical protein